MCGSKDKWEVVKILIFCISFFCMQLFTEIGRAISDVGSWHMITVVWFQSQSSLCGIFGEQGGTVIGFSQNSLGLACHSTFQSWYNIATLSHSTKRLNPASFSQLNKNYPQDLKVLLFAYKRM
jgi:hypothetical protein